MAVIYEERLSDSPFVQTIWHTRAVSDGCDMVSADSSWDILVMKQDGKISLTVWGPMTQAKPIPHPEGSECVGIRFKLGTFMPHLPTNTLLNAGTILPEASSKACWLGGSAWQFPDFENADTFVDRLVRENLLVCDPVVDALLHGHINGMSLRSVQRRFLRATGLTQISIRQIERARQAMVLLHQGLSILDTVHAAGYFDQSHMTNSLKRFIGQTPAQIVHVSKPE